MRKWNGTDIRTKAGRVVWGGVWRHAREWVCMSLQGLSNTDLYVYDVGGERADRIVALVPTCGWQQPMKVDRPPPPPVASCPMISHLKEAGVVGAPQTREGRSLQRSTVKLQQSTATPLRRNTQRHSRFTQIYFSMTENINGIDFKPLMVHF